VIFQASLALTNIFAIHIVVPTFTSIGACAYYYLTYEIPFSIFTQFKLTKDINLKTGVQINCLTLSIELGSLNNTCYIRLVFGINEVIRK
jgi:hypothetical protein